jgi:hypothetical protein
MLSPVLETAVFLDSKGPWRWCITLGMTGFLDLSIVRYSKNWRTKRFGNWICFRLKVRDDQHQQNLWYGSRDSSDRQEMWTYRNAFAGRLVLQRTLVRDWVPCPHKSLRKLAQQTGMSYSSCRKAAVDTLTDSIQSARYSAIVTTGLWKTTSSVRVVACKCGGWPSHVRSDFLSDEAWLHHTRYVNCQNTPIWSTENPHATHETPLHPVKIGMWFAMSRRTIVGPIFFENTINSGRYIDKVHESQYCVYEFRQNRLRPLIYDIINIPNTGLSFKNHPMCVCMYVRMYTHIHTHIHPSPYILLSAITFVFYQTLRYSV